MMNTDEIAELFYRDLTRLLQEVNAFADDATLWRVLQGLTIPPVIWFSTLKGI